MSAQLPKHLQMLNKAQLESLCVSCGACCHPAIPLAKGVTAVIPEIACKHLVRESDGKTNCAVYETRLEVAKSWCHPLAEAIDKALFPNECPYVKDLKGYVGTTILNDRIYDLVKPQIQKAVFEKGLPDWASEDAWKSFCGGIAK